MKGRFNLGMYSRIYNSANQTWFGFVEEGGRIEIYTEQDIKKCEDGQFL
jgi:hypothetical protein